MVLNLPVKLCAKLCSQEVSLPTDCATRGDKGSPLPWTDGPKRRLRGRVAARGASGFLHAVLIPGSHQRRRLQGSIHFKEDVLRVKRSRGRRVIPSLRSRASSERELWI